MEDSRLITSMCLAAAVMLVSMILVMMFRHFITRQLKEIDEMADAKNLEDVESEIPDTPQAAVEA